METRGSKRQRARQSRAECECPVCLDTFTKDQLCFPFGCCHGLCPECDEGLASRNDMRCPACRQPRHGVTSAEAEAAAHRNAPVPDHALETGSAFVFFPSQAGFSLTNAFLFGGDSDTVSFDPPRSAMGYGRRTWRATSRFALPSRGSQNQTPVHAQPAVGRALLLAQTASAALCDPEMDNDTFAMTVASALMGQAPPPTTGNYMLLNPSERGL